MFNHFMRCHRAGENTADPSQRPPNRHPASPRAEAILVRIRGCGNDLAWDIIVNGGIILLKRGMGHYFAKKVHFLHQVMSFWKFPLSKSKHLPRMLSLLPESPARCVLQAPAGKLARVLFRLAWDDVGSKPFSTWDAPGVQVPTTIWGLADLPNIYISLGGFQGSINSSIGLSIYIECLGRLTTCHASRP